MYHTCRFCQTPLEEKVIDLGMSPVANAYVKQENIAKHERFYPLQIFVCTTCWLMQAADYHREDELFTSDYAYYSSFSESWLRHSKKYVEMATHRFRLTDASHVVEIASNDGYLLQYFKQLGIPATGVEPCREVAEICKNKGIPVIGEFFGRDVALKMVGAGQKADLVVANNVFAHVPDVNDFAAGVRHILKPDGVVTMEFQNATELLNTGAFDTLYHEHFSYYSLLSVQTILARHNLTIFDVEKLPTHGGSLRIYARHTDNVSRPVSPAVNRILETELNAGMNTVVPYRSFGKKAARIRKDLQDFLNTCTEQGRTVAAYGAPAKGNTLLNYCGVRPDQIAYTVDLNPHKQNTLLPGTRIPVVSPGMIAKTKPDYILILPWNLKTEIMKQLAFTSSWGCKFVVPVPRLTIYRGTRKPTFTVI